MSGSQIEDGMELDESPLDSIVTALQTGQLVIEEGELEETPIGPVIGDVVAPDWAPSLQDVADLVPELTRGPTYSDGQNAGGRRGIFQDDTDPTADEVEGYIVAAVNHVVGRVGVRVTRLNAFADLSKSTTTLLVQLMIERKLLNDDTDDTDGAFGETKRDYLAALADLKDQARRVPPRLY